MAKARTIYVCGQCGYSTSGWMGRCPACGAWGSLGEEASDSLGQKLGPGVAGAAGAAARAYGAQGPAAGGTLAGGPPAKAQRLSEIDEGAGEERLSMGIPEFDRVLGGGLVRGSLVLVGGDPGIGKSTLLLQACETARLGEGDVVLYASGEESCRQIKMRARRLGVRRPALAVAAETRLGALCALIDELSPKVVVVDSIQTLRDERLPGAPGSVPQVRDATLALMAVAKATGTSFFIVGHVTKEGAIAGPKLLEHMVDTVVYFEGERRQGLRVLRAVKNRFGSTDEIGVFEMSDGGLAEVANPSAALLSERPRGVPGSVVIPGMEGTRPLLVEVQALVSPTGAQNPRRMSTGLDYNRVTILSAVLEKRLGLKLYNCDVYANVTGGIRLLEPASDLGVVAAVASSYKDAAFDPQACAVGEVGLTGEVRSVDQIGKRLAEARRMGFTRCLVPEGNLRGEGGRRLASAAPGQGGAPEGMEIVPARHVIKIFDLLA